VSSPGPEESTDPTSELWDVGPGLVRAFLGLGSNLGDRRTILRDAVAGLSELPAVTVVGVSRLYETAPVGGPDGQGPFLNLVAELVVSSSEIPASLSPDVSGAQMRAPDASTVARFLLGLGRRLEERAHRERTVRWGPRTLDVDVLLVGGVTVDDDDLQVPHPRMFERPFVLVPLAELAPELASGDASITSGETVVAVGRL